MPFERSRVEINLDNFFYNLKQLHKFMPRGAGFMQVVKADAYGHGAYEIAKQSMSLGAVYLGVANAEEGALLRYQDIRLPILILSPSFDDEIDMILENGLTPSISSCRFASQLNRKAACRQKNSKVKIHIEIDTGMGRSGFHYKEALRHIRRIHKMNRLEIEGIFSHFSCSERDAEYSGLQKHRFMDIIKKLTFPVKYIHIDNSAGVVANQDHDKSQVSPNNAKTNDPATGKAVTNLVRLGLLSYGIYPHPSFERKIDVRPVMSYKSAVCRIRTAGKGEAIGYNRTFIASRETRYAIIPVGYADGYDYLLSNRGIVRINGHYCPVIGRISMDMLTVDITGLQDIRVGSEVLLVGNDELRAEKIVARYDGLSYELLAQIGRRARRYYHQDGEITSTSPLARRDFVPSDFTEDKLNIVIESAINQRLQSEEIASLLYGEILKRFFIDKDRNIHYRRKFAHHVAFSLSESNPHLFNVETTLTFRKILQQNYFYVACATRSEELQRYFRRRDVEYRWLLDSKFSLTKDAFQVTKVSINNIDLQVSYNSTPISSHHKPNCIEIKCTHPQMEYLVGKEVDFSISTYTFYPRDNNQLAIYITELTKGVKISFSYPQGVFDKVDAVTIFSGQKKYPVVNKDTSNRTEVISEADEWIFPNSGVVFSYSEN